MIKIKLFNSLNNKLEVFKSLIPKRVSIYVCGPTVYDSLHIGNLRPIIVFDILRRMFIYLGYKVNYVSNFTDIDDKIILRAIKEKQSELSIANQYIKEAKNITKKINALKPTTTPRATEYIKQIINFIIQLIKKKNAYVLNNNVYFKINSIKNYGQLSNININKLKITEKNIEKNEDFVLWKQTNLGINWQSPWGFGRPGWHTECCVIINTLFPKHIIDIHAGGFDLKFPHHENEIAQNKACYNNNLARYWLHNGFIEFNNQKMSKSLNNIVLAKDMIKKYGGNAVRLALLSSHYRMPIKINENILKEAKNVIQKLTIIFNKLENIIQFENINLKLQKQKNKNNIMPFIKFIADDLNIANALSYLFDFLKEINNFINIDYLKNKNINKKKIIFFLNKLNNILYLLGIKIKHRKINNYDRYLIKMYYDYHNQKNFKKSDYFRNKLFKKKIYFFI